MPLPSPVTLQLAMDNLIWAEHLGFDLEARCVGCGERTGQRVICPRCAEERKRAEMAEHGHSLACYQPDAALAELCGECRPVVSAMRADT